MTKKEAIQAMLNGKKVKFCTWESHEYIYFNKSFHVLAENGNDFVLHDVINEVDDNGWEIYQEPPKTESWAEFIIWCNSPTFGKGYWIKSQQLYRTLEECKAHWTGYYSHHHEIEGTRVELPVVEE